MINAIFIEDRTEHSAVLLVGIAYLADRILKRPGGEYFVLERAFQAELETVATRRADTLEDKIVRVGVRLAEVINPDRKTAAPRM